MRTSFVSLAAWGCGVAAIAVLGAVVFGLDPLPAGLLGGAGLLVIIVAVADRLRPPADLPSSPRLLSAGATIAPAGLALVLIGIAAFGEAIWLLGAALGVGGVAASLREGRQ